jgi:hypothetical protein
MAGLLIPSLLNLARPTPASASISGLKGQCEREIPVKDTVVAGRYRIVRDLRQAESRRCILL